MQLRSTPRAIPRMAELLALAGLGAGIVCLSSCSGGGGGGGGSGGAPVGTELPKPDGSGTFFKDPNQGGHGSSLRIVDMAWGRLVDVHDVDAAGRTRLEPAFRDFVVNENIQTDLVDYRLETNPITQKTRLVILRTKGDPDTGSGDFTSLLRTAAANLPVIIPKNDDGTSPEPFSSIARNACLIVRFNDLLRDDEDAERDLFQAVHLVSGYPPTGPADPRIVFDRNHGGLSNGQFHSTRILVDMTVSEAEAAAMLVPQPLNSLGLDASEPGIGQPNVSLRIPTRVDFGSGQFVLLRSLSGRAVATGDNGPVDSSSPTVDVVRAMRSGNRADVNNGFLLDFEPPIVVGTWPIQIQSITDDPAGSPGFGFLVDFQFSTACQAALVEGDILSTGTSFLEVVEAGAVPSFNGEISGARVRFLGEEPLSSPTTVLGSGIFRSLYFTGKNVPQGCWVTFSPAPETFPNIGVSPFAGLVLRFSEPMDPASVSPFDAYQVVRGPSGTAVNARSLVIGTVQPAVDLREFMFSPALPFAHLGTSERYHVRLRTDEHGASDLAGNSPADQLPQIEFQIDPNAPIERNGGVALRFESLDEIDPFGSNDLRGQTTYDLERGTIKAREVRFYSKAVDRTNPIPSLMIPFAPGVQTPLSPLGSKLHAVWRYSDLGWSIRDETNYNVDVTGLHWSPIGGQVVSDFFPEFEIRLAHSRKLPDEAKQILLGSKWPRSGLEERPRPFADNVLVDPVSPQKVVHPRFLGYRVDPVELFLGLTGTFLMPFPLNRTGGPLETYTWRDTSIQTTGAPDGVGVPMDIEVGPPLFLENGIGSFALESSVPSVGLPLLMEFRCYPSESSIGLNPLDISLAINTSSRPNFRAYSTGGIDVAGQRVMKNPDFEITPSGGFNPGSTPPGKPTRLTADNALYTGQLDLVIRVTRTHSVWIDTLILSPRYVQPIVEPKSNEHPDGTNVVIDVRGADGFLDDSAPFDAEQLDPYGELPPLVIQYHDGDPSWSTDAAYLDGARYFQLRFSFFNNIERGLSPELSSVGIAFEEE